MQLYINEEQIKLETKDIETLGRLLETVRDKFEVYKVIAKITVDDVEIPYENIDKMEAYPLNNESVIHITTTNLISLVQNASQNAKEHHPILVSALTEISNGFRAGQIQKYTKHYIDALEGIELFLSVAERITFSLQLLKGTASSENNDMLAKFIDILQRMMEAQKNGDYILLSDMIEYELIAALNKLADNLHENAQDIAKISPNK